MNNVDFTEINFIIIERIRKEMEENVKYEIRPFKNVDMTEMYI